jgi:hypothetical protein
MYATDLRKLQRGLTEVETWCECCNIEVTEDKIEVICFSFRRRVIETRLTLNGRNIPFVTQVKYLGIIFYNIIKWRLYTVIMEDKTFRAFIEVQSLSESERLNAHIKLTFHKSLIRHILSYACPDWGFSADTHLLKLQHPQNKFLRTTGNFCKVYAGSQFT